MDAHGQRLIVAGPLIQQAKMIWKNHLPRSRGAQEQRIDAGSRSVKDPRAGTVRLAVVERRRGVEPLLSQPVSESDLAHHMETVGSELNPLWSGGQVKLATASAKKENKKKCEMQAIAGGAYFGSVYVY